MPTLLESREVSLEEAVGLALGDALGGGASRCAGRCRPDQVLVTGHGLGAAFRQIAARVVGPHAIRSVDARVGTLREVAGATRVGVALARADRLRAEAAGQELRTR